MIILSSPSGVGKTTLTKKIQQKYPNFKISVSHTTRIPRSNEVDGVDYHFVSKESFKKLIDQNKFYEYAKIFENYYGTLRKPVDEDIISNDLIFDIEFGIWLHILYKVVKPIHFHDFSTNTNKKGH